MWLLLNVELPYGADNLENGIKTLGLSANDRGEVRLLTDQLPKKISQKDILKEMPNLAKLIDTFENLRDTLIENCP